MRRLVVVGSVTGAPGVTTTALALATAWPPETDGGVRPVVVEADCSGGDLMMRFGLSSAPSLLDVAAVAGKPHPGSLLGAVAELPFGVRAVVAVPGRRPCTEAVRLLATDGGRLVLRGEESNQGTVLLDAGRLSEDVDSLLRAADEVVLVTRGGAEPLTHVSAYGIDSDAYAGRLTLGVVGPCPYPAEEIAQTLGIERVVFLPWDPRTVDVMRSPRRRALRTTGHRVPPLMAAARMLARQLASGQAHEDEAGSSRLGGHSRRGLVRAAGDDGSES
ncbi:MinD/ParA family protein [Streptomyces sp. NPDC001339]|uniref:MinD/ParA family ATP-binding protein n=1 Tax=Streptomyces sp. NPDC001339 TaxID=3364563 RepID=UPI0036B1730C